MYELELRTACDAATRAGRTIMCIAQEHYGRAVDQADRKVLTLADLEADRLLKETLMQAFPEDGWLSEETRTDHRRLTCSRVWIVDPLDGTREFVMHNPEYVVSVALVVQGEPVLGVVYNPATDDLYAGAKGGGVRFNGTRVSCGRMFQEKAVVEVSRSDIEKGCFAGFDDKLDLKPCGSIAFKLARLSAGLADSTLSVTPKNEWDIAAGVFLVTEAGGHVTDLNGRPYRFNQTDTLVDGVIAATQEAYEVIRNVVLAVKEA